MTANELRIGNYVFYEKNICKIVGINYSTVYLIHGEYLINTSINSLKPIPLTEEILLKCGFEIYAESSVSKGWKIGVNPVTHDYLMTLIWIKDYGDLGKYPFYMNGHFEIKYLHQLQNLYFALTNKELEINL